MRPERKYMSPNSLNLIGIPAKFHNTSIEDFKTYSNSGLEEVKDYVAQYLSLMRRHTPLSQLKGICFFGSNGVGKTMLACIILKEAYKLRYTARRVTFVDYMSQYTLAWSARNLDEKEAAEDNLYTNYKAVEFLVLEEVGKEVDSKASAPILEDLLRYREDNGLITIICTNLSPKDLNSKYGASIESLLRGNTVPIQITGKDKRSTK